MIEAKKKENPKLTGLNKQMKDMNKDYDDMKVAREEHRKQLVQRFDEAYDKIEENRKFTVESCEKVHQTLNEFQRKFEAELQSLGDDLHN